ncbi:unnamed protein product [Urochloa decumbens]|uniref:PGG domain-containing protein n=1 Tax=Urochloa decumbens TaxID=240449 RepID=A0ABC9B2F3_9POAL
MYRQNQIRMDPALYKAATQGDVETLKRLLLDPEDPIALTSTTPQLNTALHLAALHGHAAFAGEVLEQNEELLVARNDDGNTPLHLAARSGKLEVAELLIMRALAWPQDMKSPLIMVNKAGNNAVHEAVRHHKSAVAVALLDADPSRGHDHNERMESPLHIAAREGLVQVVQKIVDFPWVDMDYIPSAYLSGTALHQAVLGTNIRTVEILLEKRPELIDLTDCDGNNALHYAAQNNYPAAVEMLLNKRTELAYMHNDEHQCPLHVAARYGSTEAIKVLLQHCPDVAEMADALSCLLRHVRTAELLNRVDRDGDTPLHLATKMSRVDSALALMLLDDHRVDICIRNRDGHTARSLVEMKFLAGELDAYEMYLLEQLKHQESKRCRKEQLPPILSARRRPLNDKDFDKVVDAYFIAATLIATVTFASTFTMPGGYDQTKGIALHGKNPAFKTFVVSNTVAMCSSIIVIFLLIWARQEPIKLKLRNLLWSQTLTIIACLAMLLSLMTAVYLTVAPTAPWPAYTVIAIGTGSPALFFFVSWIRK